jgi:hypothetical protein
MRTGFNVDFASIYSSEDAGSRNDSYQARQLSPSASFPPPLLSSSTPSSLASVCAYHSLLHVINSPEQSPSEPESRSARCEITRLYGIRWYITVRSQVLKAGSINMTAFWYMAPRSLISRLTFQGCILLPSSRRWHNHRLEWGSIHLWNVGLFLRYHKAPHPRRLSYSITLQWSQ